MMTPDEIRAAKELAEMRKLQKVPDDHPLMVAWEKYQASEEYAHSFKWANFVQVSEPMQGQVILSHPHTMGSMWAAFSAGFSAAIAERDAAVAVLDFAIDALLKDKSDA